MGEIMDRKDINNSLIKGAGGVLGGIGLFILNSVGNLFIPGLVVGGAIFLAGLGLVKKEKSKLAGMVCLVVGALTGVAWLPLVGSLASFLLVTSGIVLVAGGGFNVYKAVKGIQSRT